MCLCVHLRNCTQNTVDTQQISKPKSGLLRSALPAAGVLQARATAPALRCCTEVWVQAAELSRKVAFLVFSKTSKAAWEGDFNELHLPTTPQQKAGKTTDRGNKGRIRNVKGGNGSWGRLGSVGEETTLPNFKAGRDIAREKVQLKTKKKRKAWMKCQQILAQLKHMIERNKKSNKLDKNVTVFVDTLYCSR